MRKLIAVLAACVGAMGLHAATTGTSFEGLIPEGAESTNYVDVLDVAGAELSGTPGQYWNVNAGNVDTLVDEFIVTTNYGGFEAYSGARNSSLSGNTSKSYLTIATKKGEEVTRFAQTNHDAVAIASNGSYYFDSLVQFTAFETNKLASEVLVGDGKMAIWLQAGDIDPETLEPLTTNLVVSAGYLTNGGLTSTATNYLCTVGNNIQFWDGGWHRVTVKAFDTIYESDPVPGFAIAIDGESVIITNSDAGIAHESLTPRAKKYHENNQRLFPSLKLGHANKTVTSVSFQGVGSVDDLVFSDSTDVDIFFDDMFTIELGANVTSAVYSVGGGTPVQITAGTQIPYEEDMVVTISNIGYADGYMKLGCGPADTGVAITTNADSYVVTVSAANKTVTIDAQAIGATIVDGSATPVVTPCASAADAFALISAGSAGTGPFTVTLATDADSGIELNSAGTTVILDLAGKTITGDSAGGAIVLNNGSLIITNSTVDVGTVNEGVSDFAVKVNDDGATCELTIAGGIFNGAIETDSGDPITLLTGGKFRIADNVYAEDYLVPALPSGYELAEGTGDDAGYYIAREIPPAPTTATVTFDVDGDTSAIASQTVDIGDCATEPSPAPSKDGYTFDCWKLNDVEFNFSTAITEDITLVAAWTINTYDVTFTTNGVAYVVQNKDYNTKATKPADPVGFAGKEFKSWQQEGYATDYDFDTLVTSNFTIVATWSNHEYSVTYNLDLAGATNAVDNIATFTVETPAFTLLEAGCDGYTFNGWTNEAGTVTTIAGGATGDITLYASWTAAGGGLDPESGVTEVEVTAESAAAAEATAKAEITVPADSGADPSDYAEYFKYGVESIGVNTYEVSITGIVETIEVSVAESAVQRLTDSTATDIDIPAGLYFRITPSTDLPISGTPTNGLSTGSVPISKPGTDKGFYKVELNATPLN